MSAAAVIHGKAAVLLEEAIWDETIPAEPSSVLNPTAQSHESRLSFSTDVLAEGTSDSQPNLSG